jgi:hypothetical protein
MRTLMCAVPFTRSVSGVVLRHCLMFMSEQLPRTLEISESVAAFALI